MEARIANTCMNQEMPVVYQGKRYKRINAIICRKFTGSENESTGRRTQAELYDGESNSVVIADIDALSFILKEDKNEAPE